MHVDVYQAVPHGKCQSSDVVDRSPDHADTIGPGEVDVRQRAADSSPIECQRARTNQPEGYGSVKAWSIAMEVRRCEGIHQIIDSEIYRYLRECPVKFDRDPAVMLFFRAL